MNNLNRLFWLCILASSVSCLAVYGIYFDNLSESSMMTIAYGWTFLMATGIAGLIARNKKNRVGIAVTAGVVAVILLFIFFTAIFPSL